MTSPRTMYRDPLDTLRQEATTLDAAIREAWARYRSDVEANPRRRAIFDALRTASASSEADALAKREAAEERIARCARRTEVAIWTDAVASLRAALDAVESLARDYEAFGEEAYVVPRTVAPFPAPDRGGTYASAAALERIEWRRAALTSVLTGADSVLERSSGSAWLRMTVRRREVPFALIVDTGRRRGAVGFATSVPWAVPSFEVTERSFADDLASMLRFRAAPSTETGDEAFDGIFHVRLMAPFDASAGGLVAQAALASLSDAARSALVRLAHFEVPRLEVRRGRAELWMSEHTCFEGERGLGRSALREIVHTAMDALAALRTA